MAVVLARYWNRKLFISMSLVLFVITCCYLFSWEDHFYSILDSLALRPYVPELTCDNCNSHIFNYSIVQKDFCKNRSPFLLILVISKDSNLNQRNAIRETWGSVKRYKNLGVKTLFVLGARDHKNGPHQDVILENNKNHDILSVNLPEKYDHLTLKSRAALQWTVNYCPAARYILKTDDDCFNNPRKFVDYLTKANATEFVGGFCFTTRPNRNTKSKWYTPENMYPDVYFPVYCGGPAYVLSAEAAQKIHKVASNTKHFHMEDIFLTGFCRTNANLMARNIPGVQVSFPKKPGCDMINVLNIHKVSPSDMYKLWKTARHVDEFPECKLKLNGFYKTALISTILLCAIVFICKGLFIIYVMWGKRQVGKF